MNAGAQTWVIKQDRFGIMYFANNSGLLRYNGQEWKLIPLPNKTIVRSMHIASDDKIYVGGQDAIGYFFPNHNGSLKYHSLVERIPPKDRSFGDVWNIVSFDQSIFFRTSHKIFKLNRLNLEITVFESTNQTKWGFMGISHDKLYAQNGYDNLVYFDKNQWRPIVAEPLRKTLITSIHNYGKDTSLISTLRGGLFLLVGNKIWQMPVNQEITKNQIFTVKKVNDNTYALGTVSNGIYFINKKGAILRHFSTENGMQNNNILSLFIDSHFNLWAGLDEGIDLINFASPIQKISPKSKGTAPVYTANIFNSTLYLGTSDGLYATKLTVPATEDLSFSQSGFGRIENSDRQVWSLFNDGEHLFMAHHDGAFLIENNKTVYLDNTYGGYWLFRNITGSKNIITGTYGGLQLFQIANNKVVPTKKLASTLKEPLRFIEIDYARHTVWASHPYRGIYKITVSPGFESIENIELLTHKHGLPSDLNNFVFKISNQIIFTTEKGIFEYDYQNNQFLPSRKYLPVFGNMLIKYMVGDSSNRIWFATEKGMGVVEQDTIKWIPELDGLLIAGFENIYPFNENNIFIGSNKGIIHLNYNLYQKKQNTVFPFLNKVVGISNKDSLLFDEYFADNGKILHDQSSDMIQELPSAYNSFHFEYASNQYGQNDKTQFSYFLKGFDKDWSAWSNKTEKDYTNLSHGAYSFYIKSKDNKGNVSNSVIYSFIIKPRWHETNIAKAAYIILLLSLIGLANRIHRKRLQSQKEKFEKEQQHLKYVHDLEMEHNEKEIVQLKNERLETEVMYKNKELATTTMHLYKRGRLLGKIKDEVANGIKKLGPREEKSDLNKLLKLIVEEEKEDQDWAQFSIHFDQVHNNFLHNLKLSYPVLSAGDLKICAYIKMNLSSKEIAQLLNISLKGVEIGRYRLRKKLGLTQDVNLTGFINTLS